MKNYQQRRAAISLRRARMWHDEWRYGWSLEQIADRTDPHVSKIQVWKTIQWYLKWMDRQAYIPKRVSKLKRPVGRPRKNPPKLNNKGG